MIQDKRIKNIVDYTDSRDCFPGVDIAGGICYFLIDREYSGKCKFTNITNGISRTIDRNLDEYDIVPRHIDALSIITKVKSFNEESLDSCVSVQTPFGFHTSFRGNDKAKKEVVNVLTSKGWVKCERSDITKGISMINQYKVIFTAATTEHAGQVNKSGLRKVISSLQIIKPNCICTQSYLVGGSFDNEDEAKNMLKYFQTKFLRFLLFQAITSQHISRDKFQFVPVQDFKFEYDDKYLFDKYQLNEEEISLIENSIAPI
jgi:site-specific DNA-methyltransferase (adenine-specific)